MHIKLSPNDLDIFFNPATIDRGMKYARKGKVISVSGPDREGRVFATVAGSGGNVYDLHLLPRLDNRGMLARLSGACSCPVGSACKHMVAVLVSLNRGDESIPETLPPAAQRPLPHDLMRWFDALGAEPDKADGDIYPKAVRDRLIYVLSLHYGRLTVITMKTAILTDGRFSAKARPYNADRLKHPDHRPKFVLRGDLEILDMLDAGGVSTSSHGYYYRQRFAPDAPVDLLAVLRRLALTGRAFWQESDGPSLHETASLRIGFRWTAEKGGRQRLVMYNCETQAELVALPSSVPIWLDPASGAFGLIESDLTAKRITQILQAPAIEAEHAAEVVIRLQGMGVSEIPLPVAMGVETRQGRNPVPVLRLFGLSGRMHYQDRWQKRSKKILRPAMRLAFDYEGYLADAGDQAVLRVQEGRKVITIARDPVAEKKAVNKLNLPHLHSLNDHRLYDFGKEKHHGGWFFSGADWNNEAAEFTDTPQHALRFMAQTLPSLRAAGWRVDIGESWPFPLTDAAAKITAGLNATGTGLFDFGLSLTTGGQEVDLAPIIATLLAELPDNLPDDMLDGPEFDELIATHPCFVPLPDGQFVKIDALQMADLLRVLLRNPGLVTKLHPGEAGQLYNMAEALAGCGIPFQCGEEILELGRRLNALTRPEIIVPPAPLQASLRPYQATGYGWLSALSQTGFGGLLADDMGLGKTVQTLALLVERHLVHGTDCPSLLIVPTSLARAWARQAAQFAPDLRVLVLQGNHRKAYFDQIDTAHVVISTYPLLHRDHDVLLTRDWDMAVLDEAQAVKNPAATATKRIREIRSRMRLALTGTPMENSLTDLWTLFDWLVPGLLGDRKDFRAKVALPIERDGDARVQEWLNRRIRPFLLRRTKQQVALDLPPKTEITELVPLGTKQQALYETVRVAMDKRVREAIAARGIKGAHITILDALLKMRQACCDPLLLKDGDQVADSAKRARLIEMLSSLVQEGRRVLVFSQFVEMLRLIEADVKAQGWGYEWLTGDTRDRDGAITRFQDGKAPIFLISLKAGGVGLTLTAAETVILYDPWWNPAVERQAMDRAHRIGQDKSVFVYRLVAEGTVEEAILALQARKQALADALFEEGTTEHIGIDAETITKLFAPVPESESVRRSGSKG